MVDTSAMTVAEHTAYVRAMLDAESAALDARDAAIEQGEADLRTMLDRQEAELRRTRVANALEAARGEREGWPAAWNWRGVLAEYGVDEYGRPLAQAS